MTERNQRGEARYLFFVPSFYGALAWGCWLVLYLLRLVRVDGCGGLALSLYLLVELMFMLSAAVVLPRYTELLRTRGATPFVTATDGALSPVLLPAALHAAGFAGLVLYVLEVSRNLGGVQGFILALISQAYAIRWEMETASSLGTQLSYFGWLAVSLSVYQVVRGRLSRRWLAPAVMQFLGNLLFIDRTRPLWILFTTLVLLLPALPRLDPRQAVRWLAGGVVAAFVLFWLVAEWTGKSAYEGKYDDSVLPGISQEFYLYGVSGFAYFNRVLESREEFSYGPVRFFYPVLRYLARFGVAEEPPSQVLEFYDVPFSTNVGTFLEPFYRDGGLMFVLCGIIIYSFGLDLAGLVLLQGGRPLALYAWATVCFTSFIGFFTPKISSFPVWLFLALGLASLACGTAMAQRRQQETVRP